MPMHGSRKFCQGIQLLQRFLVDEGREDLNTTIRGSGPVLLRNPIFVIFQGYVLCACGDGGGGWGVGSKPLSPPLDPLVMPV